METKNESASVETSKTVLSEQIELPLINLPFMLKQARVDAGKTTADIADQLRLKAPVIESLENEDFYTKEHLTTFMRGYIRSYAKLLNIPAERVEAAFNEMGIQTRAEVSLPSFRFDEEKTQPLKNKYAKIITYSIIAILILLVFVWRHPRQENVTTVIPVNATSGALTIVTDTATPISATSGQPITTDIPQPPPAAPLVIPQKNESPKPASKSNTAHPAVWQDPDFMPQQANSGAAQ
jgi:cytoskeleton protein RodZ